MSRTERMARLLGATGLDRLARLSWRGLLILNYHRIGVPGAQDDPDLFSATVQDLDEQVRLLAERFEIVPAGAVNLDARRPARRLAMTFDDGYRDQVQAAEVLHRHGVPGSFFISTGFVDHPHHAWWDEIAWLTAELPIRDLAPTWWLPSGLAVTGRTPTQVRGAVNLAYKRRAGGRGEELLEELAVWTGRSRIPPADAAAQWMTWSDVRRLRDLGMEIGGHTVTHPVLATLDEDRQRAEIAGSVRRLGEETGTTVDTFAYPVGSPASFDERTRAVLGELGIRRAFSFCGGVNRPGGTARHAVRRAGVFAGHSPVVVRAMAAVPGLLAAPSRHAPV